MKQALVLEDDFRLARDLANFLEKKQLNVKLTTRLDQAIDFAYQKSIDLALIDRLLPDGDGLELVSLLSQGKQQSRLIVISALNSYEDKIEGLKKGADYYLPKPFTLRELDLKVDKLLSSYKLIHPDHINYADISLNTESGLLKIADEDSSLLRPQEAKILTCLMVHQKSVVTHELLIDYVWGSNVNIPDYRSLATYIRRIRIMLGPARDRLRTIRGIGYQLL